MRSGFVRPYRPADLDALYDICLRTAASGEDASDMVEDPRLFGEIYAAPYAVLEPEHSFVLDDGTGQPVGYVLGALDSAAFETRCEAEWWPALRRRHPLIDGERMDDLLIALIHNRPPIGADVVRTHPSHLHIDLLPEFQREGWGRKLLHTLFDALRSHGSSGVHLGVSVRNEGAVAFYRRMGFDELDNDGVSRHFGLRL